MDEAVKKPSRRRSKVVPGSGSLSFAESIAAVAAAGNELLHQPSTDETEWGQSPFRPVLLPFRSDRNLGAHSLASVPPPTSSSAAAPPPPLPPLGTSFSSSATGNATRSAAIALAADEDAELPAEFAAGAFGVLSPSTPTLTGSLVSEGRLVHISFPSTLPFKRRRAASSEFGQSSGTSTIEGLSEKTSAKNSVKGTSGETPLIAKKTRSLDGFGGFEVPEGASFGRLHVHASGKVNMEIGGLLFDVTNGLRRQEYEEIIATIPDEDSIDLDKSGGSGEKLPAHYVVLGKVVSTVIVTPSLEAMVADMDAESESKAQRLVREYHALEGEMYLGASTSTVVVGSTGAVNTKRGKRA
jgi:hypothetical protein